MLLFDKHWYGQSVTGILSPDDLLEHYRSKGRLIDLSPSPYFDIAWYRSILIENDEQCSDAFQDFLDRADDDVRDPHPLFNMRWYKARYMDGADRVNPLDHYISIGWKQGAQPHPLFWSSWYRAKYLKGDDKVEPFYHYITQGFRERLNPNPLFESGWYTRLANLDLTVEPLWHYIYGNNHIYDPHPLFDTKHYRKALGRHDKPDIIPLEHYFASPEHGNPCVVFDPVFFYARLKQAGLEAEAGTPPLVQYVDLDPAGVVDPHPLFSNRYYLQHAPDVRLSKHDPLTHYMSSGWMEKRQTHPLFDAAHYTATYPDAASGNPLVHYLTTGYHKGFSPRGPANPDQTVKALPDGRNVVDLPTNLSSPPDHAGGKIGAFVHVFYPELSKPLLGYTNNIPGDCTVYISTDTAVKAQQIEAVCVEWSTHPYVVRVLPNRGRDIGPMLTGFRDALLACDYGVHIHTKKSPHYGQDFDAWRRHLLDGVLGTPDLVENILAILAIPHIGAVIPDHYPPIRTLLQWGGNFQMLKEMLWLGGEELSQDHILDLPSGSMFWFKTAAFASLLELGLEPYHFDPELGQIDGTLAHAIERGFLYFIEAAGFEWIVGRAQEVTAKETLAAPYRIDISGKSNRIFPTNRDLGSTRKYFPECTRFLLRPSAVRKPRLNLLIPLVDTGRAYAGVATAIDVFNALAGALGDAFDARMIATDVTPGNQFAPPLGYVMSSPLDDEPAGVNSVVDAAQRFRYPMYIRDNDIFLSTAWWTAANGFDMLGQQDRLFGPRRRQMAYLIQDFECGFYPWSTKYALAEQTYTVPQKTIPIFNTALLKDFFVKSGYYPSGFVLDPPLNPEIRRYIDRDTVKQKIVVLYARPHAERNCLPFLDMLVDELTTQDPGLWSGWRFCAIGETFGADQLKCTNRIEILGRLTLQEYGEIASKAALGVSLMISPHPSYPPLEMADAGILTLANTYGVKDLADIHDNIESFSSFNVSDVAGQLSRMARRWQAQPAAGWAGKPKVDWFFGGKSNIDAMARDLAAEIQHLVAAPG